MTLSGAAHYRRWRELVPLPDYLASISLGSSMLFLLRHAITQSPYAPVERARMWLGPC
jgi:hypothetical protein